MVLDYLDSDGRKVYWDETFRCIRLFTLVVVKVVAMKAGVTAGVGSTTTVL